MDINIENIKKKLLVKYPTFGSVIANTNIKEDNSLPTIDTDGKTIYYNTSFIDKLNEEEKVFVFSHEICHIAFDHIDKSKDKNLDVWGMATDAVINALLKEDGLSIVDGYIDMDEAINYSCEELYRILLNEYKEKKTGSGGDKKKHNMWGMGGKDKNKSKPEGEGVTKLKVTQNYDALSKKYEKEMFKENKNERTKRIEELKKSLTNQICFAGSDSKEENRKIENIGKAIELIDWKHVLKESIKYDVDWSYLNAEIEDGVVSAKLEEESYPETEIVLDTSGSINRELLRAFLKECKNIIQNSRVKVGCFDVKFYGFKEIKNTKDIDEFELIGNGGTEFNAAVNAFTKRVENKIIFTDGEAGMPVKELDAVWIVFGTRKINPRGGKVVYINKNLF